MKVLNAVNLGMPILGTRGAFSGVPWFSRFDACIDSNENVAGKLKLFADKSFLITLSRDIIEMTQSYIVERDSKFSRFIESI